MTSETRGLNHRCTDSGRSRGCRRPDGRADTSHAARTITLTLHPLKTFQTSPRESHGPCSLVDDPCVDQFWMKRRRRRHDGSRAGFRTMLIPDSNAMWGRCQNFHLKCWALQTIGPGELTGVVAAATEGPHFDSCASKEAADLPRSLLFLS